MKYRDMARFLRDKGYVIIRSTSHEIWGKGSHTVAMPHISKGEINKMVARRLMKEIEAIEQYARQN